MLGGRSGGRGERSGRRAGAARAGGAALGVALAAISFGFFEGCGGTDAGPERSGFGRDADYAREPAPLPATVGERLGRTARLRVVEREGLDALRTSFVTDRGEIRRIVHMIGPSHPISPHVTAHACEPCNPELTLYFEDEGGSPLGSLALFCAGHGVERPTRALFTMPPSTECAELTVREPDALRAALEPSGVEGEADRPDPEADLGGLGEVDPPDGVDGPDRMPADALPAPVAPTAGCKAPSDCASSEQCRGPEGCSEAWSCVPAGICTRDLTLYCGCDGKTFRASSTCPGRPFLKRGRCPTVALFGP